MSSNQINVYFTFPTTESGISSIKKTFTVSGPTRNIDLVFDYPPTQNYVPNDCLMFDNYVENGPFQTLSGVPSMSLYCTVTTTTNIITTTNSANYIYNNPSYSSTSQVIYQGVTKPITINSSVLIILAVGGIGVIGIVSIIYSKQRQMNLRRGSNNSIASQTTNSIVNNSIYLTKNFCVNCHSKIDPSDRYCQNCGSPIILIE